MNFKIASRLLSFTIAIAGAMAGPATVPAAAHSEHVNAAVAWNQTMLATFANANVAPAAGNRLGAIVEAAVFDAVNGIAPRYAPIHVAPGAPEDASPQAAAAGAAYTALVTLFPLQKTPLDAALMSFETSITDHGEGRSIADGLAWGQSVATQILAWRAADGFNSTLPPYVFGTAAGDWQPTLGGSGPPRFRTLAVTAPFALTSPSEYRPAGPPALTSARYAQDLNELEAVGGLVSTHRTPSQTETAQFWQLDTPTALWDRVADSLALKHHRTLLASARLLALVNIALADATIAVFDAKNAFNFWRPATAIVEAGSDGNPATAAVPTWLPLLTTPYFQEYPSAHSGVSAAAAMMLASTFGDDTDFTMISAGLPGVTHTFTHFSAAVAEVANARVYAGFHFRFSCEDGIHLGLQVSERVQSTLMLPVRDSD
jgi:hypothetical protein